LSDFSLSQAGEKWGFDRPVGGTTLGAPRGARTAAGHRGRVADSKWRELAYVVEFDELEQAIRKTIDRIRQRDGAKIANEVADRLAAQ
jgi:hypothetical protein